VQRIGRIEHQPVLRSDALEELQHLAEIAADLHRAKLHLAVGADHGDAGTFRAEEQHVGRHGERAGARERQRHLHVRAGQEVAVLVREHHLDLHGARLRVDRARGAHDLALEVLAAQLLLRDGDLLARLHQMGVGLRHVHVHAQGIGLRQDEERAAGAAARVDQIADVDVAPGDDAGERRHYALEALELAQPLDVGVRGGEVRLGLRVAAFLLIELLLRHRVALAQRLPALVRAAREREARGGLLARGDRLRELLVDLRRLDLGEELALLHAAADVLVPLLQVAAGARRDRRLDVALQRARQHHGLRLGAGLGLRHAHVLLVALADLRLERLGIRDADVHRAPGEHAEADEDRDGQEACAPEGAFLVSHFSFLRMSPRCTAVYTTGTKIRVETVANTRPPITARPSGAFCSPPSPSPSAIGIMPMIIAAAVISTGRMRVAPAFSAAASGSTPRSRCWRANAITKMLLAVATPIVMIAPVNAGTESVVPVMKSIHAMPPSAAGSAAITIAASIHDWKLTTISR